MSVSFPAASPFLVVRRPAPWFGDRTGEVWVNASPPLVVRPTRDIETGLP